jgi:hypothetical protein
MAEVAIIGYQPVSPSDARYIARTEQWRQRLAKSKRGMLARRRAAINQLDERIEHLASVLTATRAKIGALDAHEFRPELKPRTYRFLTAGLVLLETPLNKLALDFLRLAEVDSYIIAFFIALTTALAAKFTGRVLRQKAWRERDWCLLVLYNVVFALAIWKIAELRGELAGNASAGATVAVLQAAAYLGVVALSFAHVDPDGRREQFTRLAAVQDQRLDAERDRRCRLASHYDTILAAAEHALAEMEHDCIERIVLYQEYNTRWRSEPAPEYFRRPLTRQLFEPIDLGEPLDAHPREIGEVIGQTNPEEEGND